jgi:hypothetical protein
MPDQENCSPVNGRRPWNKGKLIGARPPFIAAKARLGDQNSIAVGAANT